MCSTLGAAAATSFDLERQAIAMRMRRIGAQVVTAAPDQLAPAVADAYLDLKKAGKLHRRHRDVVPSGVGVDVASEALARGDAAEVGYIRSRSPRAPAPPMASFASHGGRSTVTKPSMSPAAVGTAAAASATPMSMRPWAAMASMRLRSPGAVGETEEFAAPRPPRSRSP